MFLLDDRALLALLQEDLPHGDLTSRALGIGPAPGRLRMAARDPMVLAGVEEAARIFALLGARAEVAAPSGAERAPGAPILAVEGPAEALFAGWKVAQTLMEWASGLATSARALVRAAAEGAPGTVVACTRKTVPGTRALAFKAVTAGGATLHRTGLSDTVLLFPEHRPFAAGDLRAQLARLRAACPEKRLVIEVTSIAAAEAAAEGGADVIQLEKFPPEAVAEAVRALEGRPVRIAAAGGIHPGNAAAYAAAGAQVLVTSAPYQAPPRDVAVTLEPA
ncbi:ModD protein [Cereibacter johrii]|uniref:ModD protein n=1 Tax=Cereibacter johrii TaxID=445629 RepID=UPI003CF45775